MDHFWENLTSLFTNFQLIELAIVIFSAIFLSLFLNNFLLPKLRKRAARTQSVYQRMLFKSLRGESIIWVNSIALVLILSILKDAELITSKIHLQLVYIVGGIVLISFLWFIKDLSDEIIRYYARKGSIPRSSLIINLIKYIILVIVLMVVLDQVGIDLTSLIAALGLGGLALALALQDTLNNIISGLSIISAGQIKQDDYIELETGEAGYVRDISWRNTTIETLEMEMVIIPNAKLSNTTIRNANRPQNELLLRVNVGIDYGSDLELVEQVTLQVAKKIVKSHEGGIEEFEPRLLYKDYGESSINFSVVMKVAGFDYKRILKHHFIKELTKEYAKHNIDIPFPIRTVKMAK